MSCRCNNDICAPERAETSRMKYGSDRIQSDRSTHGSNPIARDGRKKGAQVSGSYQYVVASLPCASNRHRHRWQRRAHTLGARRLPLSKQEHRTQRKGIQLLPWRCRLRDTSQVAQVLRGNSTRHTFPNVWQRMCGQQSGSAEAPRGAATIYLAGAHLYSIRLSRGCSSMLLTLATRLPSLMHGPGERPVVIAAEAVDWPTRK